MPVARVTCLCGCGWWYAKGRGRPPAFARSDCWDRAERQGLAESVAAGRRLTKRGLAALGRRRSVWECECGGEAAGPETPCARCRRLDAQREADEAEQAQRRRRQALNDRDRRRATRAEQARDAIADE